MACFAAATALLLLSQDVHAHALLVRADPQPNSELTQPPDSLQFWFSEPLEETFTGARILDVAGAEIPTGAPQFDPADPTHLTLPLETIEPGVYTVVWQTLSSVDGHEWIGSFPLTILNPDGRHTPAGTAVEVTTHREEGLPPLTDSLLRWLSLLGAALLVGPLSMRWLLARSEAGDSADSLVEPLISSTAIVGVILLIASGWLQFLFQSLRLGGMGDFPELLLATRPGRLLLIRQTLLAGVIPLLYPNGWAKILFRRPLPPGLAPRLWSLFFVLHAWLIGVRPRWNADLRSKSVDLRGRVHVRGQRLVRAIFRRRSNVAQALPPAYLGHPADRRRTLHLCCQQPRCCRLRQRLGHRR